ncbi:DUF4102 domain-containing protein [Duganella sp. S19_KUP01_CR8]|uniref:DUF4102 domain-containing protein n=1 Tax=Duganella sp. S19_KUP01_CR8 TaxID=3025502 RepID=UPI002FCDB3C1
MSKYVLPLTDTLIEQAAPKEKPYKLFDGAGLYLEVTPGGSKIWRMKYCQRDGREYVLTFGRYPEVAIDKAREHRLTAHQILEPEQDPGIEFNRKKLYPLPKPIPIDEIFDEPEWEHVQSSILHASRHAIHDLEAALFPSLERIPTDEAGHNIQQAAIRQVEQDGLQTIYRQLESVATALAASYLQSGMSMEQLVSAMNDTRSRMRRADDKAYSPRMRQTG